MMFYQENYINKNKKKKNVKYTQKENSNKLKKKKNCLLSENKLIKVEVVDER